MRMKAYLTGDSNVAAVKVAADEPVRCMVEFENSRRHLMFTVSQDGAVGMTWDNDGEPHETIVWYIGQLSFPYVDRADPQFEMLIPQRQP